MKRYPKKRRNPGRKSKKSDHRFRDSCIFYSAMICLFIFMVLSVETEEVVEEPVYDSTTDTTEPGCNVQMALYKYMKDQYLEELLPFYTTKTKGTDAKDTAQKIVEWQEKALYYSTIKASNNNGYVQSPHETILAHKGICVDYAILAAALVEKQGYTPYVFVTTTKNHEYDHAFAAVKQGNTFYAIDQVSPSRTVKGNLDYLKECYPDMVITHVRYYEVIKNGDDITINTHNFQYN